MRIEAKVILFLTFILRFYNKSAHPACNISNILGKRKNTTVARLNHRTVNEISWRINDMCVV